MKETEGLPGAVWKKIYVPILNRKHKRVSVYENQVRLKDGKNVFRQLIVKDHGRSKPTFILTNNTELSMQSILEVYAKR
ncbi:hypothetical protein SCALIN_C01_0002 [Candidatus Scalindua japonica]|uniref:Uncharacterized protein n=1 Tax=Candidatus Scalindua japonica TaxID=1284222 RepID=A0A286TT23_9BACT|nr:hypothetical protein [Candidatus Scalindua japonica]GAX59072.1 hypothetical protein SCALIN_C01_0002 [Candidatus Scalindua japonica]